VDVLTCIFRITVLCVIMLAAVQHLSRTAMQKFDILRTDVNTGFAVSVCCEVTSPKWTEWEGVIGL
jgi:hypothetical protein